MKVKNVQIVCMTKLEIERSIKGEIRRKFESAGFDVLPESGNISIEWVDVYKDNGEEIHIVATISDNNQMRDL